VLIIYHNPDYLRILQFIKTYQNR